MGGNRDIDATTPYFHRYATQHKMPQALRNVRCLHALRYVGYWWKPGFILRVWMSMEFVLGEMSRGECPGLGLSSAYNMPKILNWTSLPAFL